MDAAKIEPGPAAAPNNSRINNCAMLSRTKQKIKASNLGSREPDSTKSFIFNDGLVKVFPFSGDALGRPAAVPLLLMPGLAPEAVSRDGHRRAAVVDGHSPVVRRRAGGRKKQDNDFLRL